MLVAHVIEEDRAGAAGLGRPEGLTAVGLELAEVGLVGVEVERRAAAGAGTASGRASGGG